MQPEQQLSIVFHGKQTIVEACCFAGFLQVLNADLQNVMCCLVLLEFQSFASYSGIQKAIREGNADGALLSSLHAHH